MEYIYFNDAFKSYAKTTKTNSDRLSQIVDKMMKQIIKYKDEKYIPYVCCLSEAADLLSQWRGYGDDGRGVALGFDFDRTGQLIEAVNMDKIELNPFITKIEYADIDCAKVAPLVYHNIFPYLAVNGNRYEDEYQLGIWQAAVSAIKLKHFGFQEEKEHRIVYIKSVNTGEELLEREYCLKQGSVT